MRPGVFLLLAVTALPAVPGSALPVYIGDGEGTVERSRPIDEGPPCGGVEAHLAVYAMGEGWYPQVHALDVDEAGVPCNYRHWLPHGLGVPFWGEVVIQGDPQSGFTLTYAPGDPCQERVLRIGPLSSATPLAWRALQLCGPDPVHTWVNATLAVERVG